jgi:hypothetical protein
MRLLKVVVDYVYQFNVANSDSRSCGMLSRAVLVLRIQGAAATESIEDEAVAPSILVASVDGCDQALWQAIVQALDSP